VQEEVTEKSIALTTKSTKMSMSVLKYMLDSYLKERDKQKTGKVKDVKKNKTTLKKLSEKYDGLKSIEVNENNIKGFERIAKKYKIEYALKKDKGTDPPTYAVFFKGKDTDILDQAFREFLGKEMNQEKRPSLRQALKKLAEMAKGINSDKTRNKHQEKSL